MKKILALLILTILCITLLGCTETTTDNTNTPTNNNDSTNPFGIAFAEDLLCKDVTNQAQLKEVFPGYETYSVTQNGEMCSIEVMKNTDSPDFLKDMKHMLIFKYTPTSYDAIVKQMQDYHDEEITFTQVNNLGQKATEYTQIDEDDGVIEQIGLFFMTTNGEYSFHLTIIPKLSAVTKEEMLATAQKINSNFMQASAPKTPTTPSDPTVQSSKELLEAYMDKFDDGCDWSQVTNITQVDPDGDTTIYLVENNGEVIKTEDGFEINSMQLLMCSEALYLTGYSHGIPTPLDAPVGETINIDTDSGLSQIRVSEKTVGGKVILLIETVNKNPFAINDEDKERLFNIEIDKLTGLVTKGTDDGKITTYEYT